MHVSVNNLEASREMRRSSCSTYSFEVPLISKKLVSHNVPGARVYSQGETGRHNPGGTDRRGLSGFQEAIVPLSSVLVGLYKGVFILVLTGTFFLKEV